MGAQGASEEGRPAVEADGERRPRQVLEVPYTHGRLGDRHLDAVVRPARCCSRTWTGRSPSCCSRFPSHPLEQTHRLVWEGPADAVSHSTCAACRHHRRPGRTDRLTQARLSRESRVVTATSLPSPHTNDEQPPSPARKPRISGVSPPKNSSSALTSCACRAVSAMYGNSVGDHVGGQAARRSARAARRLRDRERRPSRRRHVRRTRLRPMAGGRTAGARPPRTTAGSHGRVGGPTRQTSAQRRGRAVSRCGERRPPRR